ncbi:MAG TPA: DUF4349 domain-containing protein [Gaiellaceae bacterium]|nr:DUF4349 domain-containing protein [Gaiellaceae bacterium]
MTSSPDLIHELRASRPAAPTALRARIREISARETAPAPWARFRFPVRRAALIAVPAAAALAFASAGVLGLARSDGPTEAFRDEQALVDKATAEAAPSTGYGAAAQGSAIGPTTGRAQRVSATLTVEVPNSDAVSRAAQDALDLTRSLGGHVVSASVATGDEGSATLTVRVPVAKVQEAIVRLSALGRIVSQQVTIDDLQESLDALERRAASVRNQIARIAARLESESLDAETRAVLENRLKTLRTELRELRRGISATNAEARMSTIQLTVVTPGAFGAVAPPARLDRTIDEALNVLVWEAVIALALLIVVAPFALVALAAWLGRRLYRRREEERLLAT